MKLVATEAIRLSARHTVQPGEAFELDDAKGAAELLQIGAAREDDAPAEVAAAEAAAAEAAAAEAGEGYMSGAGEPPPATALVGGGAVDAPAPVTAAKPARRK